MSWRDILHEGPVPARLSLADLSRIRARFLADEGLGEFDEIRRSFSERDDILRRFTDYDEVVLWFEWDLYDQLQLIQILDFVAATSGASLAESGTTLSMVSLAGYLGNTPVDVFASLFENRMKISRESIEHGRRAWTAFRSDDPRELEAFALGDPLSLEFLPAAFKRQIEELPSLFNGLSRSESQILESVSQGPLSFTEIFKRVSSREERIYCGDATMARYIERMSLSANPLITYPTGENIDAPRTDDDSRSFRNAEMCLSRTGKDVLAGERDWIALGGSDRWLGGVHLDGLNARWRWDSDASVVVDRGVAR